MSLRYIDQNGNEMSIAGIGKDGEASDFVKGLKGNGRITSADIEHYYTDNLAHEQFDIVTSSMTTNKPAADGFIKTFMWDNSGEYDVQIYIPNNPNYKPQIRFKDGSSWSTWKNIECSPDILFTNTSGATSGTLSASVRNYSYIEVFYTWSRGTIATGVKDSVKVFNNYGDFNSYLAENVVYSDSDAKGGTYGSTVKLVFSTTTFRSSNAHEYEGAAINSNNDFKVTRVLGYK